jgi:hypothetical protein
MKATKAVIKEMPPTHAASVESQQQLLPIKMATALPIQVFLWFIFIFSGR